MSHQSGLLLAKPCLMSTPKIISLKLKIMIISTTDKIPNKEITEILGIAKGSTVRAKHLGQDIFSGLKSIVGGELDAYTSLLNEAREQAIDRIIIDAQRMGANAIVNVRLTTSSVMDTASEILAYGTAVKLSTLT
jgi:uncharacterized protein YbjQ (UPF0145 family)